MPDFNTPSQKILEHVEPFAEFEWDKCEIIFTYKPTISKGSGMRCYFSNKGNTLTNRTFPNIDMEVHDILFDLIEQLNKTDDFNTLVFNYTKGRPKDATLYPYFDKALVDNFEALLPKSKRGKIIAWYKQNIAGNQIAEKEKVIGPEDWIKSVINRMPKREGEENLPQGFKLSEYAGLLKKYIDDSANPYWENGLISIQKEEGQWTGNLQMSYYEEEEEFEAKSGRTTDVEADIPTITGRMKSIWNAIQTATSGAKNNKWNGLFVSFDRDGLAGINFELDGEEVDID